MKKRYTSIESFFIFCSGADTDWLNECPRKEDIKFYCIGSLVFMTGLLGFISSSYAFHSMFNPAPLFAEWKFEWIYVILSMLFGLVWGTFIFFLDRAFVATMSKNSPFWLQLLQSIPRFALAFLLSISISKPIEIYFFKDRIKSQIAFNAKHDVERFVAKEQQEANNLKNQIEGSEGIIQDLIQQKSTLSAEEEALLSQLKECQASCLRSKAENQDQINATNAELTRLRNNRRTIQNANASIAGDPSQEFTYQQNESAIRTIERSIQQQNSVIQTLNNSIQQACACQNALNNQLNKAKQQRVNQANEQIAQQSAIMFSDTLKLKTADSLLVSERNKIEKTDSTAFSETLCNQVGALQDLLNGKGVEESTSEVKSRNGLWWMHIVIWLIFLAIEIAPVSMKLMLPRGEYDDIARAHHQSMEAQLIRYKQKRETVYNHYYTTSETQSNNLIDYFFTLIGAARKKILEAMVKDWEASGQNFSELIKKVSTRLFDEFVDPTANSPEQEHEAKNVTEPTKQKEEKGLWNKTKTTLKESLPKLIIDNAVKALYLIIPAVSWWGINGLAPGLAEKIKFLFGVKS